MFFNRTLLIISTKKSSLAILLDIMDTGQEDDIAKDVYTASTGGGVYSSRLTHVVSASQQARNLPSKTADIEMTSVSEETDIDERDFRKKQVFSGWTLAWYISDILDQGSRRLTPQNNYRLSYQSLGVIYGDIGTSPLYVFSSTFSTEPSRDDILGAVSLVVWALTIMVSIKYVCIVLNADDEGEGGTFAVYSLLSRYVRRVYLHPPFLYAVESN